MQQVVLDVILHLHKFIRQMRLEDMTTEFRLMEYISPIIQERHRF